MLRGIISLVTFCLLATSAGHAQSDPQVQRNFQDKFRQLDDLLPTPNMFRNGAGAPGPLYWQQKVDYRIKAILDDQTQTLTGTETITYTNNSPDTLRYLWVQLDQNRFNADSIANLTMTPRDNETLSYREARLEFERDFGGGHNITSVKDMSGGDMARTIVGTMMRIDLPEPLGPNKKYRFSIDWNFKIADAKVQKSRSGYEYFEDDDNYIYTIAQWFPRLAAYTDVDGWNNKEFVGNGEFVLEFGDYDVEITVPDDHLVAGTGVLQNPKDVLTAVQRNRLQQAETAETPILIVTPEQAETNETSKPAGSKTWIFRIRNVRDFAFASSRKFIWDAQGYEQTDGSRVLAMSFYPKEANPLWQTYSTHAIIHALEIYSRYTFPYPYPVAQSVNGPIRGMEYPTISFNGFRPKKDDDGNVTYSGTTKYDLISVVIHEIGHNYFPMIINSDERRWTWMDEGLNTFVQFLAEQEWQENYPSERGEPRNLVDYMKGEGQVPIMTHPDSILDLGNSAYAKPSTALVILRESILGRELFDFAFREYALRWRFKRPTPADFFRTMEDASGVDLDWFWRGWFYGTDHVDISIDAVTRYTIDTKDPDIEKARERDEEEDNPISLTRQRNEGIDRRVDRYPELLDFYNENDRFTVTEKEREKYQKLIDDLEDWERDLLTKSENFYMIEFSNKGGLVMPIVLSIVYMDGSEEELRLPAEIWRQDARKVTKLLVREDIIDTIVIDPYWETSDIDIKNNHWPRRPVASRLELRKKDPDLKPRNLMKDLLFNGTEDDNADVSQGMENGADAAATDD